MGGGEWNANDRITYNPSRARAGSFRGSACGPCCYWAWLVLESGCICEPVMPGMRASKPSLCQFNQPALTRLPSPSQ